MFLKVIILLAGLLSVARDGVVHPAAGGQRHRQGQGCGQGGQEAVQFLQEILYLVALPRVS